MILSDERIEKVAVNILEYACVEYDSMDIANVAEMLRQACKEQDKATRLAVAEWLVNGYDLTTAAINIYTPQNILLDAAEQLRQQAGGGE